MTTMRTIGMSPKMVAAVIGAILGYLATQQILDLPAWADLLVQAVSVAFAAYIANPGTVTVEADDVNAELRAAGEAGQSVVEWCFALAFLAIAIWVLSQVL